MYHHLKVDNIGLLFMHILSSKLFVSVFHILAEMSHFHDQKVTDFKNMMQHFLQEQISFHQRVSLKLIYLIQVKPAYKNLGFENLLG